MCRKSGVAIARAERRCEAITSSLSSTTLLPPTCEMTSQTTTALRGSRPKDAAQGTALQQLLQGWRDEVEKAKQIRLQTQNNDFNYHACSRVLGYGHCQKE